MFVAFEGVDGAGKSTQVRLLGEHLERSGREVVICREPGGTGLGEELLREARFAVQGLRYRANLFGGKAVKELAYRLLVFGQ